MFVEFDDVIFATRALQDMYGNTIGGLVKGGIRLSYSKVSSMCIASECMSGFPNPLLFVLPVIEPSGRASRNR